MDDSMYLAGQVIQRMEEYYPQFLTESGFEDTYLSRVAFYGGMIESVSELPLPDTRAQTLLIGRLREEYRNAQAKLQEELFKHLLNGK